MFKKIFCFHFSYKKKKCARVFFHSHFYFDFFIIFLFYFLWFRCVCWSLNLFPFCCCCCCCLTKVLYFWSKNIPVVQTSKMKRLTSWFVLFFSSDFFVFVLFAILTPSINVVFFLRHVNLFGHISYEDNIQTFIPKKSSSQPSGHCLSIWNLFPNLSFVLVCFISC